MAYCKITEFPSLKVYEMGSEVQTIDEVNLDSLNVELDFESKNEQEKESKR